MPPARTSQWRGEKGHCGDFGTSDDPAPGNSVPQCNSPCGAGSAIDFTNDPDCDGWVTRIDNCPQTRNGDAFIVSQPGGLAVGSSSVIVDNRVSFTVGDTIKLGPGTGNEEVRTITSLADGPPTIGFSPITTLTHNIDAAISNQYSLVANAPQGQDDLDIAFPDNVPDRGSRGDVKGPECESGGQTNGSEVAPDGHYHRIATISRACISDDLATHDVDGDGLCNTGDGLIDPNDGNIDSDGDNKPNNAAGGFGTIQCGESSGETSCGAGFDFTNCLDSSNNDGDLVTTGRPMTDLLDVDCFGIDTVDNCISVANAPKAGFNQADGDMDGLGDACDSTSDSDGDGEDDSIEIHVGTSPQVAACSSIAGVDNEFVDGKPQDLNDSGSIEGADLDRIAGVIGSSVGAGPPQANMGPVERQRLRVDMRPLPEGDGLVTGADLDAVAAIIGTSC